MFEANLHLYVPAAFLLMLMPGPANALVMSRGARSVGAGLMSVAGVLASVVVLLAAAILGVSSILIASQPAFLALKWAGAAYLCYLGVKMILGGGGTALRSAGVGAAAWEGFLTGVTNPKALIFYFAFLPQFVTDRAPVQWQLVGLGVVDLCLAAVVFSAYALAGAQLMRVLSGARVRAWLDRCVGAAMIASAFAVLRTARPAH